MTKVAMQLHTIPLRRSSVLIAALLAATLSTPSLALATAPAPVAPSARLDPAENQRRITWGLQLLSCMGLTLVAGATAVGLGLGAGVLASEYEEDRENSMLDRRGERTFLAVTSASALLLIPPAAALGVDGVGRRRGQQGSYRTTMLYSLAGGAGAFALTFLVAWPALSINRDQPALGAAALAAGISTLGFVGGAMYGHAHSVERASARAGRGARLSPGLHAGERALSLSVRGTF
jgi:O-antigen/teichoic acid export membrane protein